MDSGFSFLSGERLKVLREVVARRNSALANRLQRSQLISRSDAEELIDTLGEYGRSVSGILARVNAARIETWPV